MTAAIIYTAAAFLFIGALPLPYAYYQFLHIAATGIFIWAAYQSSLRSNRYWPWIYGVFAIIFNPIAKFHLQQAIWALLDITAGLLLILSKQRVQSKKI